MTDKMYLTVDEVATAMCISKPYAYRIVKKLNDELEAMNYLTVAGKVNAKYFYERTCYGGAANNEKE